MYTLIDLRGFILRSYHSGKDPDAVYDKDQDKLINTAEYGVEVFIERFLSKWLTQGPAHKLILVGEGGNEYRRSLYPDYKGNRGDPASELASQQIEKVQQRVNSLLLGLGLTITKQEGAEADDLIAYLALHLEGRKLIHTVDKDLAALAALANTTVCYHSVKEGEQYYATEVDDLPPQLLTLQKAIVGDKSDNYKGVPGVGDVGWSKLVANYGVSGLLEIEKYVKTRDFESLSKDAEDLNDPVLRKLAKHPDELVLCYTLATLYPSLCNRVRGGKMKKVEWTKRVPNAATYRKVVDIFDGDPEVQDVFRALTPEFILVTKENLEKSFLDFTAYLPQSPVVSWDYETYDPVQNEPYKLASKSKGFVSVLDQVITGCSFAVGDFNQKVYYVSCHHADTDNVDRAVILEWLKEAEESEVEMVAQNSQFEAAVTRTNFNHEIKWMTDTAMFAKNLYESDLAGLKTLTSKHLNYKQATYEEVIGDKGNMSNLTGLEVLDYGCDDSLVTAHLLYLFWIQSELEGTKRFISDYDCPSMHLLVDGFVKGFPLDHSKVEEMAKADAEEKVEKLLAIREALAKHCSNPNPGPASTVYEIMGPHAEKMARYAGDSEEKIKDKLDKLREKLLEGSLYVEPFEYYRDVEFIPTPTKLNAVFSAIGMEQRIEKVTISGVTAFLVECESAGVSNEVITLLGLCAGKELKAREGGNFHKLQVSCSKILKDAGTPVVVGTELNFGSPIQVTCLLYSMLGLPVRMRTKVDAGSKRDELGLDGGPSGNEKAILLAAAEDCTGPNGWKKQILLDIVAVNKATTRQSMYWAAYPLWASGDGLIHPAIKQSATVTNRPTGTSPNILQVAKGPVRTMMSGGVTEEGEKMVYVSIDFSGQELRLTADASQDPVLLDAYLGKVKKDIHSVTGCAIAYNYIKNVFPDFDLTTLPYEEGKKVVQYDFFNRVRKGKGLTSEEEGFVEVIAAVRKAAKTVNFLIIYGGGPQGLAILLLIPEAVAEDMMDAFYSRYAGLLPWKKAVADKARKTGYVSTPYGSRRHLWPEIASKDTRTRARAGRQGPNFEAQGTAADVLKVVLTNAIPVYKSTGAVLAGPVYDELASRVPVSKVVEFVNTMCKVMSVTPPGNKVPMVPEVSIGNNWGEQVELGAYPTEAEVENCLTELEAT